MRRSKARRDVAAIGVPTLILANRQDPIHPFAFGETLARAIPRCDIRRADSQIGKPRAARGRFSPARFATFFNNTFHAEMQSPC